MHVAKNLAHKSLSPAASVFEHVHVNNASLNELDWYFCMKPS
jgi:hypothetical protein